MSWQMAEARVSDREGRVEVEDFGVADESMLDVHAPKSAAAGLTGVKVALQRAVGHMGATRSTKALLKLNQAGGFDCMSCAWPDPDPDHRHTAEFCENGAKAVAEEGARARATPEFFAERSIADLDAHDEHWLGQAGRITHPMVKRPGASHYEAITWDDAFALVADELGALGSPDEAVLYTSGRASNEAAFVYQLFVRALGTNNLPDCSNMCHESTGVALGESIGIGKGSVSLRDLYDAELIVIAGQNPGTNHPRMLSVLETAKRRGAKIISINPLREAGLVNFRNPQRPRGVVGKGTDLTDLFLPIKPNGDLALFQAIGSLLVEWDALDHDFIVEHTVGFEAWAEHVRAVDWETVSLATGLTREQVVEAAELIRGSKATIYCWAVGLTQHRNSVATIKEVVNLALVRGDMGKRGAGVCPVRGHSNVQGDRTMGIYEKPAPELLDALEAEFGFEPPRTHGLDVVDSIRAMRDGKVKVFVGLGGNFLHAAPDTDVTAAAPARHLAHGADLHEAQPLPPRHGSDGPHPPDDGSHREDLSTAGEQFVTVEDSMSSVHASRGVLEPASEHLRSEVAIVSGWPGRRCATRTARTATASPGTPWPPTTA